MAVATVEEIYEQVKALPVEVKRELVERIAHDLATAPAKISASKGEPTPIAPEQVRQSLGKQVGLRHDWMSIRGTAPNLLDGEDAQEWVSRTRREGDEHRERQWRRDR